MSIIFYHNIFSLVSIVVAKLCQKSRSKKVSAAKYGSGLDIAKIPLTYNQAFLILHAVKRKFLSIQMNLRPASWAVSVG
jgi:hypothetical protein